MSEPRLLQGDALEHLKTMPADSADAIITDPPYCSGGRQQSGSRNTITKSASRPGSHWFIGDNMGTDSYLWFMRQVAIECARVCRRSSPAYVFTDWRQYTTIVSAWETAGWTLRNVVVWDKARGGAMGSYWRNNHEWIAVFTKGKAPKLPNGSFFNTWQGTKPQGGVHPTEKPAGLLDYLVSSLGDPEPPQHVIDPFMGTCTTGVATIKAGHHFTGIEMNAQYYGVSRENLAAAAQQQRLV